MIIALNILLLHSLLEILHSIVHIILHCGCDTRDVYSHEFQINKGNYAETAHNLNWASSAAR